MRAIEATQLDGEIKRLSGQKLLAACFTRRGDAPSGALLAAMAELPPELTARLEAVEVDIDQDAKVMDEFRVFKVPELILWVDGRIIERSEGAMNAAQAAELLRYVLDQMV